MNTNYLRIVKRPGCFEIVNNNIRGFILNVLSYSLGTWSSVANFIFSNVIHYGILDGKIRMYREYYSHDRIITLLPLW